MVSSGSLSTLAMLSLMMVGLLLASGGFEWVRTLILIRASNRIEKDLRGRVSDATFKRAMATGGMVASTQSISDLSNIRQFLTGNGLFAFSMPHGSRFTLVSCFFSIHGSVLPASFLALSCRVYLLTKS